MRLTVRHQTRYDYEPMAERVALRLRLWPSSFDGQARVDWTVRVNGAEVAALVKDAWGNLVGLWRSSAGESDVQIEAQGSVATQDKVGIVSGLPRHPPPAVFLRDTALTAPAAPVRAFAEGVDGPEPGAGRLAWLHALSDAVAEAVRYRPAATTPATSAAAALELGAGVCQDQTHLFLAAARAQGVPARYVVGYLAEAAAGEAGDAGDTGDTGEEDAGFETHAWAEAFVPDIGWIGFDPTHRRCPTEHYVRLTCGLDAVDAAPVNGVVLGQAEVAMSARVEIAPDAGGAGAQSQGQSQ
ncbi:MAG: transglutaminase family protein [Pseudomonadota bacterium]